MKPGANTAGAALAMNPVKEFRDGRRGDALEHAVFRLEHDDVAVLAAHHRRRLKPDIAAAENRDAPRLVESRAQALHIADSAQREYTVAVETRQRQAARAGAGGEDQAVERHLAAIGKRHDAAVQIDFRRGRAEHERDTTFGPEWRRAQIQRVRRRPVSKKLFRQWRPLIGQKRLVADDGERPGKAAGAQTGRELRGGLSGADDDHGLVHHAFWARRTVYIHRRHSRSPDTYRGLGRLRGQGFVTP